MKELGEKLKARREQHKLTISEVSIETKINGRVITAIEEGDLTVLPAKTFLRGFIRTYATFLKMNVDDVLEDFQKQMGTTSPQPQQVPQPQVDISEYLSFFNNKSNQRKILLGIGVAIVVVLIMFIKSVYEKYELEKAVTKVSNIAAIVPEKTNDTINTEPPSTKTPVEAIKTAPEAKKVTATVKKSETVEIAKVEAKPANTPPVVEKKSEIKPEKKPEAKPATKPDSDKKDKPKPVVKTKAQEIIIEALDNIEIEYRSDTGSLESVDMKPDQTLVIKAKKTIAIDISDGGAVNVIHNGKDRGVPGDLGQSIKVKYP